MGDQSLDTDVFCEILDFGFEIVRFRDRPIHNSPSTQNSKSIPTEGRIGNIL
jgi:hypothetical protein